MHNDADADKALPLPPNLGHAGSVGALFLLVQAYYRRMAPASADEGRLVLLDAPAARAGP